MNQATELELLSSPGNFQVPDAPKLLRPKRIACKAVALFEALVHLESLPQSVSVNLDLKVSRCFGELVCPLS